MLISFAGVGGIVSRGTIVLLRNFGALRRQFVFTGGKQYEAWANIVTCTGLVILLNILSELTMHHGAVS